MGRAPSSRYVTEFAVLVGNRTIYSLRHQYGKYEVFESDSNSGVKPPAHTAVSGWYKLDKSCRILSDSDRYNHVVQFLSKSTKFFLTNLFSSLYSDDFHFYYS